MRRSCFVWEQDGIRLETVEKAIRSPPGPKFWGGKSRQALAVPIPVRFLFFSCPPRIGG